MVKLGDQTGRFPESCWKKKRARSFSAPGLQMVMIEDRIYCGVFKVGRPASGPCALGVTVKGACRVKFSTVSEGNLIC
jgi:hypothetical protein